MSSSIVRLIRNFIRVGPKSYFKQLNRIGDTKYGTLVGTDVYGNKFYENEEEDEVFARTRWVEYKDWYADLSKVEPAWHFWLAHGTLNAPDTMPKEQQAIRAFPNPNFSGQYELRAGTPGAYIPYSTVRSRVESWTWKPTVVARK